MSLLKIKPCDNTFFGDGHQFSFDISNVIRSKDTPYPSVFFGAIFTALLTQNDKFRKKFFENPKYDHERILEIGQVYLFNEESKKVYIKAPMDLFINSKGDVAFGEFIKLISKVNSLSYDYILQNPKDRDFKRTNNYYIEINCDYESYKKGLEDDLQILSKDNIFIKNYKVGIGIDKTTKNVEQGKLYKIEQTEFVNNGWSYIVEYKIKSDYLNKHYGFEKIEDFKSGYLKLGGENKVCKFKKIFNDYIEKFESERIDKLNNNVFKIVFTSETYFETNIDQFFNNIGLKVLGISNDKPIYIGGYDMKPQKNSVRKMYKGYSSGTVILVEIIDKARNYKNILKKMSSVMENPKGFNKYIILEDI